MLILVFLAACKHPHEPDEFYDSSGASADKNMASVTVYLDNEGPSNRAMGKELAQMGCDYFEVVFLYGGTAVSGQWKIGERAAVYGVYRETRQCFRQPPQRPRFRHIIPENQTEL